MRGAPVVKHRCRRSNGGHDLVRMRPLAVTDSLPAPPPASSSPCARRSISHLLVGHGGAPGVPLHRASPSRQATRPRPPATGVPAPRLPARTRSPASQASWPASARTLRAVRVATSFRLPLLRRACDHWPVGGGSRASQVRLPSHRRQWRARRHLGGATRAYAPRRLARPPTVAPRPADRSAGTMPGSSRSPAATRCASG